MTKDEAEKVIRHLAHEWVKQTGIDLTKDEPSFHAFADWLREKNYSHYLDFHSTAGAEYEAEMWFDQELIETRN